MAQALLYNIVLFWPENVSQIIPADEIRNLLISAFPDADLDKERGKRSVLDRLQELREKSTPEILLSGYQHMAESTTHVTIRWPEWNGNAVTGTFSNISPGLDSLWFECEHPDSRFLRFSARELARKLGLKMYLRSSFLTGIETFCWPGPLDAVAWIRNRYQQIDRSAATLDQHSNTWIIHPTRIPSLREIANWPTVLKRAIVQFVEKDPSGGARHFMEHFPSSDAYAAAFIRELTEFAPVQHCWSVELEKPPPFHNEVLIDQGDWLTHFHLDGIPSGVLNTPVQET